MKFRINKMCAELVLQQFDKKDGGFVEIDLEPVAETAREAELIANIRGDYYNKGYEKGYEHGWHEGHNETFRCRCSR